MKKILLTFSVLIFFSCKTDEEKAKEKRIKDSITAVVMNDFNDGFQESLIDFLAKRNLDIQYFFQQNHQFIQIIF